MPGLEIEGYELELLLRRTPNSRVWRARSPRGDDVVVKSYSDQTADELVLFTSRALSAASLGHRNVAPIRDRGMAGDELFVVRDYCPPGSLAELSASLDLRDKLRVCVDVAHALEHAHQRGLVHGAVKPANILLPKPERALLADFQVLATSQLSEFSAPEQRSSAPITPRTDQYSLAAVTAWSLLGRLPKPAEAVTGDSDLDAALRHSLAPTPTKRFAHFDELVQALEAALARAGAAESSEAAGIEVVRVAKTVHVVVTGNWTPQAVRACVEEIDHALEQPGATAIGYMLNAQGGCHSTAIDALAELHRRHQTVLRRVAFVSDTPQARGASVLIGRRVEGLPWKTFSSSESMDAWLNEVSG